MASDHYKEFIKEAFIDPIRSVLIVDDDYPTFDEILSSATNTDGHLVVDTPKNWVANRERVASVIQKFRSPKRPLLVDIHDGENVSFGNEVKSAAHLHQTDFLVLDFELEKAKPRDGSRAIELLREVMSNNHFNLVVIHTSEKLDYAFYSVLSGLIGGPVAALSEEAEDAASDLIEAREDIDEGFHGRLRESISAQQYFYSRQSPTRFTQNIARGHQPFSAFKGLCDEAGWNVPTAIKVARYLLFQVQRDLAIDADAKAPSGLQWSDKKLRWLRSDSVFVAFSHKFEEEDLLEAALEALNDWSPQPARLFLAKLRSVMDERGVMAQSDALEPKHALAYWYMRLLNADPTHQKALISESVQRHSDQLLVSIHREVEEYVTRLLKAELENGQPEEIGREHFRLNLDKNKNDRRIAELEHNAIVCSKPPDGWHLSTGHILKLDEEYWLCLSPMCDLVPHQMSNGVLTAFGERMPFTAIKLRPVNNQDELADIQSNRYIFLRLGVEVKVFAFNLPDHPNSSPYWQTLFAENRGKFTKGTFKLKVRRTKKSTRSLVSKLENAEVVSQLRYEYALNLMQKLGGTLTRVGLDFVGS